MIPAVEVDIAADIADAETLAVENSGVAAVQSHVVGTAVALVGDAKIAGSGTAVAVIAEHRLVILKEHLELGDSG